MTKAALLTTDSHLNQPFQMLLYANVSTLHIALEPVGQSDVTISPTLMTIKYSDPLLQ